MGTVLYNTLLLNWKSADKGRNHIVGILKRFDDYYTFNYIKENLPEAKLRGFVPLIGLSDETRVYWSETMFSVFERRLPGANTSSFKKFVSDNSLSILNEEDIVWDYFCITHGKLATDSISFSDPIVCKNRIVYGHFEVAGWSHNKEQNENLVPPKELNVSIESGNSEDPYAVEILDYQNNNTKVGYVPRPFNILFYRLLSAGLKVECKFFHYNKDGRPLVSAHSIIDNKKVIEKEVDLQYLIDYQ
jgi:hypothetical protein